jgi:hypothetical protein
MLAWLPKPASWVGLHETQPPHVANVMKRGRSLRTPVGHGRRLGGGPGSSGTDGTGAVNPMRPSPRRPVITRTSIAPPWAREVYDPHRCRTSTRTRTASRSISSSRESARATSCSAANLEWGDEGDPPRFPPCCVSRSSGPGRARGCGVTGRSARLRFHQEVSASGRTWRLREASVTTAQTRIPRRPFAGSSALALPAPCPRRRGDLHAAHTEPAFQL